MTPEYYLQLMTMHGTIMVFFVLTTAPFAAFGNFFLPIQVGAEDMPLPAVQHDVVLGHVRGFRRPDVVILRERRTDPGWLDPVRAAQCGGSDWRARAGYGCSPLGSFYCTVLRWPVVGLTELYPHHARPSDQRDEPHAPATQRMGMVHYVVHGADSFCRVNAGVYPRHSRSRRRDQLLFVASNLETLLKQALHGGDWEHRDWPGSAQSDK